MRWCLFTGEFSQSVNLRVATLLVVFDALLELPLGVRLQPPDVVHRHAEPLVRPAPDVLVEGEEDVPVLVLEGVQQSYFGSQFAFWHFNLQIKMPIGAQMRTFIPHLKPILDTSKLKIEIQIH